MSGQQHYVSQQLPLPIDLWHDCIIFFPKSFSGSSTIEKKYYGFEIESFDKIQREATRSSSCIVRKGFDLRQNTLI